MYPLLRVDELFASLAGGKYFTKLDMSNAYLQLPVDEQSKDYLVINTHKGITGCRSESPQLPQYFNAPWTLFSKD